MKIRKAGYEGTKTITIASLVITAIFSTCCMWGLAFSADQEEKANEAEGMTLEQILTIQKIDNDVYSRKLKGPVAFTHQTHKAVACIQCHHTGDYEKCSECHLQETEDEVVKIKFAFHRNCRNCHKALKKENPEFKAPYRKCNDCHAKRQKN